MNNPDSKKLKKSNSKKFVKSVSLHTIYNRPELERSRNEFSNRGVISDPKIQFDIETFNPWQFPVRYVVKDTRWHVLR